jgi:hypothetical protein
MSENSTVATETARRLGRQLTAIRDELRQRSRRSPWALTIAGLAIAGLAYAGYDHLALKPAAPAVVLAAQVGLRHTIEFVVASGKRFQSRTLLNSARNYRDPTNVTVVVTPPIEVPVGRTVIATGDVGEYQGRKQLVCTAGQVVVK